MYNPFSLEGKTILVTGASSGIGRATAIECARLGATLILTGRNVQNLHETLQVLEGGKGHRSLPLIYLTRTNAVNWLLHCLYWMALSVMPV